MPVEWTPEPRELADLELLLSGAFHPLTGFLGHADVHAVAERGTLADGTPWPAPVTIHLPEEAEGEVTLLDPEGVPIAAMTVTERGPGGLAAGPVKGLGAPEHGPFSRLHRTTAQVREELAGRPALAVTMRGPLDDLAEGAAPG